MSVQFCCENHSMHTDKEFNVWSFSKPPAPQCSGVQWGSVPTWDPIVEKNLPA